MNREIKFRAWNGSEMFELPFGKNMVWYEEERLDDFTGLEIMQFTGLKDKNGKEIYEGDIFMDEEDGTTNFVEWDSILGGWATNEWFDTKDLVDQSSGMEVIGNIYETPDLLPTKD